MNVLNFDEILRDHIRFLRDSSKSFDAGFVGEALRLAGSLRVLVHDTRESHSLLGLMGWLNPAALFYSAAIPWDPRNLLPHHGLVRLRVTVGGDQDGGSYSAPLDDRPPHLLRWVPFSEWWPAVVVDDRQGNQVTRKDIALALANKEGGTHVDPKLTRSYEALTRGTPFWEQVTARGTEPIAGRLEFVSMRQIAHEMLRTLERAGFTA